MTALVMFYTLMNKYYATKMTKEGSPIKALENLKSCHEKVLLKALLKALSVKLKYFAIDIFIIHFKGFLSFCITRFVK